MLPMVNLDGDALGDPRGFSEIDGAESTTPERFDDAVLAERLTAEDHSAHNLQLTTRNSQLADIMSPWRRLVSTSLVSIPQPPPSSCPKARRTTRRACCGSVR